MSTSRPSGKNTKGERLEIYTLGGFQVCCGEQKLFSESRRSQKTGELLMYLITHRQKLVLPETILESLWPEKEYANPKSVMKNLVYRLKQKMDDSRVPGARSIISYSYGCYGWNPSVPCWVDADAFEALCGEARALAGRDPLGAIEKYRQALSLYRGDYLPECHYSDWVLPARHYYRRQYLRSAAELLSLQKAHRLFSQMAEDCERALLVDQLDENLHLCYMEALLEEGKIAQARAHYEQITSLIYQELGVKPSRQMRRIYQTIKAASERPDRSFCDVQEILLEREKTEGAMLCDPDYFRFLCRLERRRAEREGRSLYLGLFTLTGPDFQPPPFLQLQEAMEQLQQVLLANLRKGDVIAPWNESQFTLLLPGLSLEQAEKVLQRIRETFQKAYTQEGVVLRSSAHPLLPWEHS